MRSSAPPLLPLFRSAAQARILASIFLAPEGRGQSLADLARVTGSLAGSVHREVERLEAAGLVRSERIGRTRLIQPDMDAPVYDDLRGLITKTLGPAAVLARALAGISGIDAAAIFGSWAARYRGEPGDAPADVDLLVIGAPDTGAIYAACRASEEELGRPVNATILSRAEWTERDSGFLKTVARGPLVSVVGEVP
jgi:predicted nucleotidyltransferase